MNLKQYGLPLALSLSLSACQINPADIGLGFGLSGGSGGGVHFGTGINIPIRAIIGSGNNPEKSGIHIQEEQVISYFAADIDHHRASTQPVRGGFYRKLLGKQGAQSLVQDFYYDSGRKYNEPMLLNQNEVYQFDSLPPSGTLYTYHENGQLASKRELLNQRLISAQYWNVNGHAIR
ncbi:MULTISPECIES: hypothetical protein [Vitreoscilla]|uniref:NemA protein n=1 Tax=Vitreoscilla stercoraria TaxID=61 RepID=A0ABY4E751_VITST|nr:MULTISPECIES: hypothetical protein [Vitreoscilla]AUZ04724.2 hypothetical protein ADP71_10300 [Vitreoscilla sp. C1]UOO91591.1 hypothetical protein LVJ81_08015 [Vitreoscilla stercoraria]